MAGEEIAHTAAQTPQNRNAQEVDVWSVERALYGLAFMVGLWLRWWRLGAQPLSPWEASNSWPAWLAAHGTTVAETPAPVSATFYSLQWLLFWLGVNSDSGARFVSTIAGLALIFLAWWWRELLGRRVALIVALLVTIDPWLLGFSRLADGAALAFTLGVLALIGLHQVALFPHSVVRKRLTAAAFGLLVVSGPMGWNLLPVVVGWAWLLRSELASAGLFRREWLGWSAMAATLGGTLMLARLDALAWVASGMNIWLSQFDGGDPGPLLPKVAGGFDFWWPWLRLWADSVMLLLLGGGGLWVLVRRVARADSHDPYLRYFLHLSIGWLLWGLALWLLPGRSALALPLFGFPLLLLTAIALDALLAHVPQDLEWREAGAVVLTLTILFVSGMLWLTALMHSRNFDPVLAQAALVILGLALAILLAFGLWANRSDAAWVAGALVSVLLLVFFVRGSWRLNFGNVLVEPSGWQAALAHPEVRLLVNDMETLSSHRSGDPYQLPVQVQVAPTITQDQRVIPARPDPVVGWELRNMRNLSWVTSPQVVEASAPLPLVVTPVSGEGEPPQLDIPAAYAGSRYHVDMEWLPMMLAQNNNVSASVEDTAFRKVALTARPWWRWFVYREATQPPQNRDVILWAPLDSTAQ